METHARDNVRTKSLPLKELRMRLLFALLIAPVPHIALAQNPPDDPWKGRTTDIQFPCTVHFRANATRVVLRVVTGNDGSFGVPALVGMKGDQIAWIKHLPHAEEINVPKSVVDCLSSDHRFAKFSIAYQNPGDSDMSWHSQKYEWNGSVIKYLGGHNVTK